MPRLHRAALGGRPLVESDLTDCLLNEGCPEFLARRRLANQFHDVLLRELARLAPSGTDRSLVTNAVCEAVIRLLAELASTKPDLMATEVKRLTARFRDLLKTAIAERSGPVESNPALSVSRRSD
jgi:hypothetical protein